MELHSVIANDSVFSNRLFLSNGMYQMLLLSLRTTNCESKFNQTKTITLVTATVNQILLALRVDPLKEYHVVKSSKIGKFSMRLFTIIRVRLFPETTICRLCNERLILKEEQ